MEKKKVKNISKEKIRKSLEREIHIKREIEEQTLKQQRKAKEEKKEIKEQKLEEIVEKSKKKKTEKQVFLGYGTRANNDMGAYGQLPEEKKPDYEYMFSYLGAEAKKIIGNGHKETASTDTSIAWTDERGDKDVMDFKEQSEYAMKQATNFLLGTNMNDVSYDEKIRFNAFMNDTSNKIVFLINYGMLGMNYKTPVIKTQANNMTQTQSAQAYEIKLTDKEIKEKSMKNDPAISIRFDLKSSSAKNYVK